MARIWEMSQAWDRKEKQRIGVVGGRGLKDEGKGQGEAGEGWERVCRRKGIKVD